MSAIFGFIRLDNQQIDRSVMNMIVDKTSWWNPARIHQFHQDNIFVAHLANHHAELLQIITKHPNYPHLTVVANARIDNKKSLLKQFPELLPTYTDVEIITWLYHHLNQKCVDLIKGAFAFAVWNSLTEELFLTRDHFGVNCLHYYFTDNLLAFSSQKKSIAHHPEVNTYPDWIYIINRMYRNDVGRNSTEFKYIKQVIPAHYIKWNRSFFKEEKYWSFDTKKATTFKKDESYIEKFEELFLQSVDRRLQRSTNTGSHLSGGLDSSGISSVAQNLLTKKYNRELSTFSYTIHESLIDKVDFKNENPLVEDVIKFANIKKAHRVDTPTYRKLRKRVIQEALFMDGFSRTQNIDVEWELLLKAKENNIDTMLSGFPGDELVTSFARMYFLEYLEQGRFIDYFKAQFKGQRDFTKLIVPFGVKLASHIPFFNAANYFGNRYSSYIHEKYRSTISPDDHYFNKNYIAANPDLQKALKIQHFNTHHENFPLSLREYQANHICRMHTSRRIESEKLVALRFNIDYRYPMLDLDLAEYILSLPVEQKIVSNMTRRIYRRGMSRFLPDSVRLRDDKNGSLKPLESYRKPIKDGTGKILLSLAETNKAVDFLNVPKIKSALQEGWRPERFFHQMIIAQLIIDKKLSL